MQLPASPLCHLHPGHLATRQEGVNGAQGSGDGLACDRVLAALEVGKSRGQEEPAPSRPAAYFACGMALRKGEAPCVP